MAADLRFLQQNQNRDVSLSHRKPKAFAWRLVQPHGALTQGQGTARMPERLPRACFDGHLR